MQLLRANHRYAKWSISKNLNSPPRGSHPIKRKKKMQSKQFSQIRDDSFYSRKNTKCTDKSCRVWHFFVQILRAAFFKQYVPLCSKWWIRSLYLVVLLFDIVSYPNIIDVLDGACSLRLRAILEDALYLHSLLLPSGPNHFYCTQHNMCKTFLHLAHRVAPSLHSNSHLLQCTCLPQPSLCSHNRGNYGRDPFFRW